MMKARQNRTQTLSITTKIPITMHQTLILNLFIKFEIFYVLYVF